METLISSIKPNIATALLNHLFENNRIKAEVQDVVKSPLVNRYKVSIEPSVKVDKICALSREIALLLKSGAPPVINLLYKEGMIAIDIPVVDRPYVKNIDVDALRNNQKGKLPVMLGYNVLGQLIQMDLASAPHLLVTGSTGSGKTVFLKNLITSLLACKSSNDIKFVLIDPKSVEFINYYDDYRKYMYSFTLKGDNNKQEYNIGHVTDAGSACEALSYLVHIMEHRFKVLRKERVNDWSKLKNKLPYLVVVVDEVADLIMTEKDIEKWLIILGQKARAVGIHLVVATQRPSADVLSGIIKVNFPVRVTFKVASSSDSRVIGIAGAENLLGKGDGLIRTNNNEVERIQTVLIE